ncbi:PREDICTED: uncharacterized protein LOC104748569 [Camelina sativa]|uniref:Uncharacterized protein LOC104748569 n=1 Tax=Camelina sativa TaxID=90675 RepID=A0ABM1QZW2_CAMSA|nr:PREDICTED: uncharacterized protein LOC104748569 [Camelina sativa]
MFDVEFSYLPTEVKVDCPPVVVTNDRGMKNFLAYLKKINMIRLCVTFKRVVDEGDRSKVQFDLNKFPVDSSDGCNVEVDVGKSVCVISRNSPKPTNDVLEKRTDANLVDAAGFKLEDSMVKKGEYFSSKEALQATMEMYAMKYNCDYRITKSDKRWWCIRCIDSVCNWRLRAECLQASTYFKINKFVGNHTCAPSKKNSFCRTPSARTIGHLIKQSYEGVKEGPKPNDIVNIIRSRYGCELTYHQAWESREYAVNEVRGIPEKSYAKIPKYLHMLQEANPGTFTNYEIDFDGRFKYLFISFGQSTRGFYKSMRKVIVVDGTFLKNKYKGVLLVATAVDGNSNLYPIAFGIADSENDYRHTSIAKSIGNIYPLAKHGICIHHLLSNVITYHKGRGVAEEADVTKWARCHFPGYRYDINTNNAAESINAALRTPREYPIIPLLDSIREMMTRWFYESRELSAKHKDPLTVEVEKKISRRIEKGKFMNGYLMSRSQIQVKGNGVDYIVDLERRTCSCGKFSIQKLPCRHAIKGAFDIGKDLYPYADDVYTTTAWRSQYEETVNPIGVPKEEWRVPQHVEDAKV